MASDSKTVLRLSDLQNRNDTGFLLTPDADDRAELAKELDIRGLRKLRFEGKLVPQGKTDWQLTAHLGATVIQECVVTLEPVTTRIDQQINRTYVQAFESPLIGEAEMPDDDTVEPLPTLLDLREVMEEALSLALPDFPRAPGVELGEAVYTEPGVKPMTDEDARPFAGLASLKDALDKGNKTEE